MQNGAPLKCEHLNYKVDFEVQRVGARGESLLDLSIVCANCAAPFAFTMGQPAPQKIRLAIAPASVVNRIDPVKRIVVPQLLDKVG
jgi:hypothetical protein